jgi:hypothetical protein
MRTSVAALAAFASSALAGDVTLRALPGAKSVVTIGGDALLSKAAGSGDLQVPAINLAEMLVTVSADDTVLQLEAEEGKPAGIVFADDDGSNRVALVKTYGSKELNLQGGRLMVNGKDVHECQAEIAQAQAEIAELKKELAACKAAGASSLKWYTMGDFETSASTSWFQGGYEAANLVRSDDADKFWQSDYGRHQSQWAEFDHPTDVQVNAFRYKPVYFNRDGTEPKQMYLYVDGARIGPFDGPSVRTLQSPCLNALRPNFGEGRCTDLPWVTIDLPRTVVGKAFRLYVVNSWGATDATNENNNIAVKRFGLGYKQSMMGAMAPRPGTSEALDRCDGILQSVEGEDGELIPCPAPSAAFPEHGVIAQADHPCDALVGETGVDRDCVLEFNGKDTRYFEHTGGVFYDRTTMTGKSEGEHWVQMKVRPDASSGAGTLFDIGGDEQHIRLDYFTRSDGKTYVQYEVKGNAGTVQVWNEMSPGQWHWVRARRFDGRIELQVDGSVSTLEDTAGSFAWERFKHDCQHCSGSLLPDCINVGARSTPDPAFNRQVQAFNYFKGQITEFGMGNKIGNGGYIMARPLAQCSDQDNSCATGPSQGGGYWHAPKMISNYPAPIEGCTG